MAAQRRLCTHEQTAWHGITPRIIARITCDAGCARRSAYGVVNSKTTSALPFTAHRWGGDCAQRRDTAQRASWRLCGIVVLHFACGRRGDGAKTLTRGVAPAAAYLRARRACCICAAICLQASGENIVLLPSLSAGRIFVAAPVWLSLRYQTPRAAWQSC